MKTTLQKSMLLSASSLAAMLSATPVFAQDTAATADTSDTAIIVTGSRIARPNLESASPIAVVTGEQTVENGDVTLDTYLNTLPQVNPAGTSTSNNPGNGGQSNINLRGLGSNRNLVLIDGRRPMVSASDQSVDLNTIPQALIGRIDVMTGGAGATYGADAIAGVVNIVLKRDFQGLDLRASYANSIPETDAREYQLSAVVGGNFADGKGNIAFAADYSNRQGLIKSQRPFAVQATSTTGTPPVGRFVENTNNPAPQSVYDAVFAKYGVAAGKGPVAGAGQVHFNADGTLFGGGIFNSPIDITNYRYDPLGRDAAASNQRYAPDFYSYNFDAINLLVLPLERKSAFMTGRYEIIPQVEFFTRAGYTEYTSAEALAPTPIGTRIYNTNTPGGSSFATSPYVQQGACGSRNPCYITNSLVPLTNPFIPADLRTILAARTGDDTQIAGTGANEAIRLSIRSLSTGLRQRNYNNQVLQGLVGFRGDINDKWSYETYYSWGRTVIDEKDQGNVDVQKFQSLLEASDGGASKCAGGYNPFGIQPISPACVAYISAPALNTQAKFTQNIAMANVTGTLASLPGGDVKANLGVENRRFKYTFDPGALSGPIAGFNTQSPDFGTNSFTDFFGELYVPIMTNLEVTLGARNSSSKFNDLINNKQGSSNDWAYKADLTFRPIENVSLRASYQRSVRAPNFGELFSGGASFVQAFDPCSVTTNYRKNGGTAASALCQSNGVAASALSTFVASPGAQINLGFAGNPDLKPEKGTTITGGVAFQYAGFTGSLDYYNIKIDDAIVGADVNMFLSACFGYLGNFTAAQKANYCGAVVRSGSNLSFLAVSAPAFASDTNGNLLLTNDGKIKTSGIDFQLGYKLPTTFVAEDSKISFDFFANYLIDYKYKELPGVTLDYAGTAGYFGAGLGQSFPRFKANLSMNWDLVDGLGFYTRLRYIGSMKNRASLQFPGESFTGPKAITYVDAALSVDKGPMNFRIGVNNLFDKQPPEYSPNVQSGTDPSLYDVIGRRAYVSARLKF